MVARVTNISYRQGTKLARGTSIDPYLDQTDINALYEKWRPEWPDKIEMRGGMYDILCEQVLEVPVSELVKTYGKARSSRILEAAKRNAGR